MRVGITMALEQQITYLLSSLFVQGVLQLHTSGLAALDFLQNVSEDYGDSVDDPVPAVEVESITIPEGRFILGPSELDQLHATVNPLQESGIYGIDLHISVLTFLHSIGH